MKAIARYRPCRCLPFGYKGFPCKCDLAILATLIDQAMGTKSFEELFNTAVPQKLRGFGLLLQLLFSRCTRLTQNLLRSILGLASKYIRIVTDKSWRILTSRRSLGFWTAAIVASSASLAALYVHFIQAQLH